MIVSSIGVLQDWERRAKRAESAPRVQQLHREIFPIHETVTCADCHRSPAPAVIYWLRNAGQPAEALPFVHGHVIAHLQPLSFFFTFLKCACLEQNDEQCCVPATWNQWRLTLIEARGKITYCTQTFLSSSSFFFFSMLPFSVGLFIIPNKRSHQRRWAGFFRKIKNRKTREGRGDIREREGERENTGKETQEQRQEIGWERRTTSLHILGNNHTWICRNL